MQGLGPTVVAPSAAGVESDSTDAGVFAGQAHLKDGTAVTEEIHSSGGKEPSTLDLGGITSVPGKCRFPVLEYCISG